MLLPMSVASQVDEMGDYAVGCKPTATYSTNDCCKEGFEEIQTFADCHDAWHVFKDTARGGKFWGGTAWRNHRPSGCFIHTPNKHVHFNPNRVVGHNMYGNDKVICKRAPGYRVGAAPTGTFSKHKGCQAGTVEITSEQQCRSAHTILANIGLQGARWGGLAPRVRRPSGCFLHLPNNHVHFNPNNVVGQSLYGNDKVICMSEPMTIKGFWSPVGIVDPTTEKCITWGIEEDWTDEKVNKFSVNFEYQLQMSWGITAGPAGGAFSGGQVDKKISSGWELTFKDAYSKKQSTQTKICQANPGNLRYNYQWQWAFDAHHGDSDTLIETGSRALTEGKHMPPLCYPGYNTDGFYYQACSSEGYIPEQGGGRRLNDVWV